MTSGHCKRNKECRPKMYILWSVPHAAQLSEYVGNHSIKREGFIL